MFVVQRNFGAPTEPCTREVWQEVTESAVTAKTIAEARRCLADGDRAGYDSKKRSLPAVCFMADHFEPNQGSKGKLPLNTWRLQSAAVLNGLVMLDFDHVSSLAFRDERLEKGSAQLTPVQVFHKIPDHWFDDTVCRNAIMLAHVTPSGDGLRLVCLADAERGSLADNQQYIATSLGLAYDEACKNADRLSFVPQEEDILYINDNIFNYNNQEYDARYGKLYRGERLEVRGERLEVRGERLEVRGERLEVRGERLEVRGERIPQAETSQPTTTPPTSTPPTDISLTSHLSPLTSTYDGIPLQTVADAYIAKFGTPAVGKRHTYLLRMAARLRPLVENNRDKLGSLLRSVAFVQDMLAEGGAGEVERILADATNLKGGYKVGKTMQSVLAGLGVDTRDAEPADGTAEELDDAGRSFWRRLEPVVEGPYLPALDAVDDENKVGAVMAAGAMFCTLMTRTWYRHYDGLLHRMNPQVYIIGEPATGKSFADRLDRNIMAAMRFADQPVRDAETRYKRQRKERSTSTKAQKGEALEQPEGMIRYLPSRTSNAVFYRRAINAKEVIDGEVMPLHLYTFDSELDSSVTAQSGGSWIGKHDLELKAFHNELSGVDFANTDSVNELIPIYWNQVVTGTPISLSKKITLRNVNDGLCSRMAIFRMAAADYKMVRRGTAAVNHEQEVALKEWGYFFESLKGELRLDRLIDHVYTLCEQSAHDAEAAHDKVLNFLRKRAVFYATWFTVPQIVGRIRGKYKEVNGTKVPCTLDDIQVRDKDLRLATVIYDAVLYYQDKFFGQMLQDSWDNAKREFQPRVRNSRNSERYEALPDEFSTSDLERLFQLQRDSAYQQCKRWCDQGYTKRIKQGTYRKIIKNIVV
jgi:hypothetical protein